MPIPTLAAVKMRGAEASLQALIQSSVHPPASYTESEMPSDTLLPFSSFLPSFGREHTTAGPAPPPPPPSSFWTLPHPALEGLGDRGVAGGRLYHNHHRRCYCYTRSRRHQHLHHHRNQQSAGYLFYPRRQQCVRWRLQPVWRSHHGTTGKGRPALVSLNPSPLLPALSPPPPPKPPTPAPPSPSSDSTPVL